MIHLHWQNCTTFKLIPVGIQLSIPFHFVSKIYIFLVWFHVSESPEFLGNATSTSRLCHVEIKIKTEINSSTLVPMFQIPELQKKRRLRTNSLSQLICLVHLLHTADTTIFKKAPVIYKILTITIQELHRVFVMHLMSLVNGMLRLLS